jgi:orotate phosphoribosyltransferase
MKNTTSAFYVTLKQNDKIAVKVMFGHFATVNSHFNHYLEMSEMKHNVTIAKEAGYELALPYECEVDTIVCMERTEVIAAYMAERLTEGGKGNASPNAGRDIRIVSPAFNKDGQLMLQSNNEEMIRGKNIILLVASVSGGATIETALSCLEYYDGEVVGISALFVADTRAVHHEINTLFTGADIPYYKTFPAGTCEMCAQGQHLDAFVNSRGFNLI